MDTIVIGMIVAGMVAGLIIATGVCIIIAMKHKPVKTAKVAYNYLDKRSIDITKRQEFFVSSTVTKQAK